jgi:hypothetical protein
MSQRDIRPQRFILLPATSLQTNAESNPNITDFLVELSAHTMNRAAIKLSTRSAARSKPVQVKVVDSIHENGAKLVEMKPEDMSNFRFSYPGLRIIPEKFYRRAFIRYEVEFKVKRSQVKTTLAINITDAENKPLKGIYVVAFTDFDGRVGDSGTTNAKGVVSLKVDKKQIERLYVYPDHSYWGHFKKNFTATRALSIKLQAIDLNFTDSLRYFYDTRNWGKIQNTVRVGVIDTGVGPHKDLEVKGGANTVLGENETDFKDNGEGHGTHVAGIIAAHGGINGVAAGVEIYSYRVFPKGGNASNFDIMKAIDRAIQDNCDIINMSLGEEELDEGIISSIKTAHAAGVLCFAANGNDDRSPVNFPASYSLCVAVSAMGRKKTFPAGTIQSGIVYKPFGTDKNNFIADFSNVGPETDLTAPGVGIISTFPNDLYAVMDGTSMATPAAAGMAARLLSMQPALLSLPRKQQRTDEMLKFLAAHIKPMGFGANFEGQGMFISS